MNKKKRQHFVPRFYLKYFSKDGKNIGAWHIKSKKYIPKSSISKQAQKNYFYSKEPELEKGLELIESRASIILKEVIDNNKLPRRFSIKHEILICFVVSLESRTEYSGEELNERINKLDKLIHKDNQKFKRSLEEFKIGIKNPATFTLRTSIEHFPIISDLKYKIIINNTKTPFITSDNPVILQNDFLKRRNWPLGKIGLASLGLQILLPLNNKKYIIFYDNRIYNVGNFFRKKIIINSKDDIDSFNKLVFLNANKTIYFKNDISFKKYLKRLDKELDKERAKREVFMKEFINESNKNKSLIIGNKHMININYNFPFIKETRYAKNKKLGNRGGLVRRKWMHDYLDNPK